MKAWVLELVQDYYEQRQNDIIGVYSTLEKAIASIDAHAALQPKWVLSEKQSTEFDAPTVIERDYDRKWRNSSTGHEKIDHYYACFIVYEMEVL